jgi:3-oxoadipate enol-lactonase
MKWIDVNGVSLRYELSELSGNSSASQVVLLVHELGGCLESWDETLPAFAREFRVLRYDQRGFGHSEKVGGTLALNDMVGDIVALLDALSITAPVHVVGSALGAGIAAAFAARHPARVARLAIQSLVTRSNPATRAHMLARADEVERAGMRANVQASLDRSFPEILRVGNKGEKQRFETYRARWLTNDPRGYAAINRMLQEMNIDPELGNITAPTLLIGCNHDVLRPLALERELAKLIPNVRYVEADSGHFMHAQSPEMFTQLVVPFLLEK